MAVGVERKLHKCCLNKLLFKFQDLYDELEAEMRSIPPVVGVTPA
jgi:hypothetical protein